MHHKKNKDEVIRRLSRIVGQINGLKKMYEKDQACPEIIVQIASIRAALRQIGLITVEDHMEHCITAAFEEGKGKESVEEMSEAIKQFMKSV